jgi:hypothetical protein
MCRRVTCRNCDKATYAGCGQHVDQVLRGIPASQRCRCPRDLARPRSVLSRLFGR